MAAAAQRPCASVAQARQTGARHDGARAKAVPVPVLYTLAPSMYLSTLCRGDAPSTLEYKARSRRPYEQPRGAHGVAASPVRTAANPCDPQGAVPCCQLFLPAFAWPPLVPVRSPACITDGRALPGLRWNAGSKEETENSTWTIIHSAERTCAVREATPGRAWQKHASQRRRAKQASERAALSLSSNEPWPTAPGALSVSLFLSDYTLGWIGPPGCTRELLRVPVWISPHSALNPAHPTACACPIDVDSCEKAKAEHSNANKGPGPPKQPRGLAPATKMPTDHQPGAVREKGPVRAWGALGALADRREPARARRGLGKVVKGAASVVVIMAREARKGRPGENASAKGEQRIGQAGRLQVDEILGCRITNNERDQRFQPRSTGAEDKRLR
ncbi:hypothetical protein CCMA1212_009579 [Trichoderma ghanense]|uniref:Uncharacterized protein n=1 Tax=Trichoderma ghanense TaxID=65468 RepID=A0ABY2GRZ7_9HYPO